MKLGLLICNLRLKIIGCNFRVLKSNMVDVIALTIYILINIIMFQVCNNQMLYKL